MFFDIGANIGYYTILVAYQLDGAGRVIAIEPDPLNLPMLELNVRRNFLRNVIVVPKALDENPGRSELFQDLTTGRTSSLQRSAWHPDGASSVRAVDVEATTLDELAGTHGMPDLVKCDVEGHEMAVLRGGLSVLRHGPIIFLETVARTRNEASILLRQHGYVFLDSEKPIRGQSPRTSVCSSNTLAIPESRLKELAPTIG